MTIVYETANNRKVGAQNINPNESGGQAGVNGWLSRILAQSPETIAEEITALEDCYQDALSKLAHERRGILESASITADAIIREEWMHRVSRQWLITTRGWQIAAKSKTLPATMIEDMQSAFERIATAEQERDAAKAGYLAAHKRMMEMEAAHELLSAEAQRAQNEALQGAACARAITDLGDADVIAQLPEPHQAQVRAAYLGLNYAEKGDSDGC